MAAFITEEFRAVMKSVQNVTDFCVPTASKAPNLQKRPLNYRFNTLFHSNTEHVQGLGANGKAAFSPKAHG